MPDPPPHLKNDQRHWLCVAYAFPPIHRSGTFRTLGFVTHLHRMGWEATVVTAEPGREATDESLLTQVPPGTSMVPVAWKNRVERWKRLCPRWLGHKNGKKRPQTSLFSSKEGRETANRDGRASLGLRDWVSQALLLPDSRTGWIRPAVHAGQQAIRRRRPNVIYSTSPYMSAHLIAMRLSRWAGVPWVADFRDPWGDNPFRDLCFPSLRWYDARLERAVMQQASHIICNTSTMRDRLCARLPLVAGNCTTILNGFDRELFTDLRPKRPPGTEDAIVLTHCGQFYGRRHPGVWWEALKRALRSSPSTHRLRIALIGPESYEGTPLRKLAAQAGVSDHVLVLGRMSHRQSLAHLAGSDALLLAGSSGPGASLQIPNKLFEYLATRKPILGAVATTNPLVGILKEAQAVATVCEPDDAKGLARAMARLATGRPIAVETPRHPWTGVERFSREKQAAELESLFDRLIHRNFNDLLSPRDSRCNTARYRSLPDSASMCGGL